MAGQGSHLWAEEGSSTELGSLEMQDWVSVSLMCDSLCCRADRGSSGDPQAAASGLLFLRVCFCLCFSGLMGPLGPPE